MGGIGCSSFDHTAYLKQLRHDKATELPRLLLEAAEVRRSAAQHVVGAGERARVGRAVHSDTKTACSAR
jgi:hypothetical protein